MRPEGQDDDAEPWPEFEAYISYEAAPETWRLKDGSRPPPKKHFESHRYDERSRTFTGTILWGENTFAGAARWDYRMKFAASFGKIASGEVKQFAPDGTHIRDSYFGANLNYDRYVEEEAQFFDLTRPED